jgi:hypothetical protein
VKGNVQKRMHGNREQRRIYLVVKVPLPFSFVNFGLLKINGQLSGWNSGDWSPDLRRV